jgi:methylenetetrahydrofolate--tRNA-(uracil-5-)-methyltransferase
MKLKIIGGGLAGSEAALQAAEAGIQVLLHEMRPANQTGAHTTGNLGELVCSNSLGSNDKVSASGLLKNELRMLNSHLIKIADSLSVPAGNSLSVDRELFAKKITETLCSHPNITVIREELTEIPDDCPVIIATGPLTSSSLTRKIQEFTGEDNLYFFDAAAPIIEKESVNFDIAFIANRYDKGEAAYINCPMNQEEYDNFYEILINSPKIELKDFEKDAKFFESCLPVEVLALRGKDTLRFGPLKPVGFIDKRTDSQPYALVQLRQDNMEGTLYNMVGFQTNLKWSAQKELVNAIPGLENASIVRYGVMHRNTFINAPKILKPTLQSLKRECLFFAGQISGVEGYTESIATGLLSGINAVNLLQNKPLIEMENISMLGALCQYITSENKHFQPMNSNFGILKPVESLQKRKIPKQQKRQMFAERSEEYLNFLIQRT